MSEFTETNNTSTYVQPARLLPTTMKVEGASLEFATCDQEALADALACWAVGGVAPGFVEGCQRLLWCAVQIRVEVDAETRLKHLADALELVTSGYADLCQQLVREPGGATVYDDTATAFNRDCGAGVVHLLRGIFAQMDRDTAALAAEGGAR